MTRSTIKHVDNALISGSKIACGAGGSGGGGIVMEAFLSSFIGLVGLVAVEVEPFRAALGAI